MAEIVFFVIFKTIQLFLDIKIAIFFYLKIISSYKGTTNQLLLIFVNQLLCDRLIEQQASKFKHSLLC